MSLLHHSGANEHNKLHDIVNLEVHMYESFIQGNGMHHTIMYLFVDVF